MASYENDAVITGFIDGDNCEIVENNLIDLLASLPDGLAAGRRFTEADFTNSGSLTKSTIQSLREDSPEFMLFDVAGASGKLKVSLANIQATEVSEIKGIAFDTDRRVSVTGLKHFSGVIELGDGNDRVSAGSAKGDITVCTGDGNDSVKTGAGNDSVSIGSGRDSVSTGAGDDMIMFDGADTTGGRVNTGSGEDEIIFTSGFMGGPGVRITINGGADNDSLDLGLLAIESVQRISEGGVRITLADETILIVKHVETFSYGDVKAVGIQDFVYAFSLG